MNTGGAPVTSANNLLTTVAWRRGGGAVQYALEGSVFVAGAAVQWLRDGLGVIRSAAEVEGLARQVESADGVVVVPAFTGLGAPHWDADARGTILGLTRGTTAAHLARATLDGIAFQVADVAEAMEADAGLAVSELRVDGGAARNDLLMQTQADLLQVPIVRPAVTETTALGAALLAGLAVGFWTEDEVDAQWQLDRRPTGSSPRSAPTRRPTGGGSGRGPSTGRAGGPRPRSGRVRGTGYGVPGTGYRGTGYGVPGTGYRVRGTGY